MQNSRWTAGPPRWRGGPWGRAAGPVGVVPPLLLAALALGVTAGASRWMPGRQPLNLLGAGLLVAAFLVLIPSRSRPLLGYCAATVLTLLYFAAGHPPGPILLAPFLGLLLLVASSSSWRVWLPSAALGGAALATVHGFSGGNVLASSIFLGVWILAAAGLGLAVNVRRRFVAEVTARGQWAQRTRAEEEGRRLAEERLRIAREVHDVVGHSLAVISLQAGVAEHLLETRPEEVRKAVSAIRRVSRQALGELRVELASLREGSSSEGTAPTPGIPELRELVAVIREAGLPVDLALGDDCLLVPAVVGSAAYRIVQEALTNVARHAGAGAAVRVALRRSPKALEVEVVDHGGTSTAGPILEGNGVAGMRERVAALNGRLEIGRTGTGVRVWAQVPVAP